MDMTLTRPYVSNRELREMDPALAGAWKIVEHAAEVMEQVANEHGDNAQARVKRVLDASRAEYKMMLEEARAAHYDALDREAMSADRRNSIPAD